MNCREFEQRIQQLLDQRESLSSDEALNRHAESCSSCARRRESYRTLLVGLEHGPMVDLADDFSRQAVAQVCQPRPKPRESRRSYLRAEWVAVAAALAALILLAALPQFRAYFAPDRGIQAKKNVEVQPGIPNVDSQITNPPLAEPGDKSDSSSDLPGSDLPIRELFQEISDRLAADDVRPFGVLAQGFRPVTSSLATALDGLWMAFPLGIERSSTGTSDDTGSFQPRRTVPTA